MTKFIAWGQRIFPAKIDQPPGNSLEIIDAAYLAGYDGIELDVRITKDGVLVLMHDDRVEKTTFGSGRISMMSTEEATSLLLKGSRRSEYVPTLTQALLKNGDRGYVMIDLRKLNDSTQSALINAISLSRFKEENIIFLAYTPEEGRKYNEIWPNATCLLKAPINLKPPELNSSFVSKSDGMSGIIAPICADPDVISEFKEKSDLMGKKLGIYLHHQGLEHLRKIVAIHPDFITSMNPSHFETVRLENSI